MMVTITRCDLCDKQIDGEPYGNLNSQFPSLFELCKECSEIQEKKYYESHKRRKVN